MSDLHVKILQDARNIIEIGKVRHTCNAVKIAVNWHSHTPDPVLIKAGQDIIDHITKVIAPECTFENWLYYKKIITGIEWGQSLCRDLRQPSKVKRMRLEWMDELIEHFRK